MSAARNSHSDKKPQTFGDIVIAMHTPSSEYNLDMTHMAYDSYVEISLREGERLRRACDGTIDIIEIKEDTPLPKQMPQFWALSSNKVKLELLSREMALWDLSNVLVSGMVINDELISPKIRQNDSPLHSLTGWRRLIAGSLLL